VSIRITPAVVLDEGELRFEFLRASGPGGQNVNKVETAVRLWFDVAGCAALPEEARARLVALAGKRIGPDGQLRIEARRFRTQEANRKDAVARLVLLLQRALERPTIRRKTKPSAGSKERRLEGKRLRGKAKQTRRPPAQADE
jgi:ribosome-associated protein